MIIVINTKPSLTVRYAQDEGVDFSDLGNVEEAFARIYERLFARYAEQEEDYARRMLEQNPNKKKIPNEK